MVLDWVLFQNVRVAHVERAGDLVVLNDRAEFEYGRRRSEGTDSERVERASIKIPAVS